MKVINKILCFLSVLVFCVPLLCFNVSSADISELTYEEFFLSGGTGDLSGIEILSVDDNKQVSVPDNYLDCPILNEKFALFDLTDSFSRFRCSFSRIFYYFKDSNDDNRDIYYIFRYGKRSDDFYYMTCHISFSPMSLASNNKIISDSEVFVSYIEYKVLPTAHTSTWTSSSVYLYGLSNRSTSSSTVLLCDDYVSVSSSIKFTDIQEVYSNCITEYNGNNVSERPKSSSLKDNIEVKLTPVFGLDMDRVFDQNTGQNDYFKFEVTNNSDNPIQFSASIVPVGTELLEFTSLSDLNSSDAVNSGNLSDYILGEQKFVNTKALWNYLTDCEYYIINANIDYEKAYFVKNTNFYVEERKGNFYWIFVPPNTTYSDYIYWENVKITPNTHYDFVFTGLELDSSFTHSSAVFANAETLYALTDTDDESIGSIFKSNVSKPWTLFSNVNTDSSVEQYKVELNDMVELFRTEFSVKTIPSFSNEIKGGNSAYSTGWNDTENQVDNPYYRKNLQTGEIEAVSNWSEYNGSSDVDVNIDNVGVGDVKNLISYSQDFFTLIKSVMLSFPTWIWVLICFGLTGLIVIAIVKALL